MADFEIEKLFKQPVIGLDEVGRGPLAGPVVSCGCMFKNYKKIEDKLSFITDSKKINANKRKLIFAYLQKLINKKLLIYKLGLASVKEIDDINILEATKLSMRRAVFNLNEPPTTLIIDGNFDINLNKYPSKSFIKGDEISLSIATASIIAKIHRDRYMRFLSYFFPYYNWSSNAGYGTKKHIEQICKKGITSHHRKTFEPIKSLIHKK